MSDEGWSEEDGQKMRERVGEDPAHVLDRPLVTGSGWRNLPQGYDETSDPMEMMRDRIRGIDRLQVVAAYLTVEHRLERGPRDRVVSMLEDRREHLEATGERDLPGRTHEELRERAEQQYQQVADQKTGRRDVGGYRRSRMPWPTGKDALDEDRADVEEDVDDDPVDVDERTTNEESTVTLDDVDAEEHPVLQGFEQAGGAGGDVATDGGTRER